MVLGERWGPWEAGPSVTPGSCLSLIVVVWMVQGPMVTWESLHVLTLEPVTLSGKTELGVEKLRGNSEHILDGVLKAVTLMCILTRCQMLTFGNSLKIRC